ncbi:PE-PPE domain-containing protein [Gordonia sp. X0973]|uniref:cutinase family protein n=1 Tax=Gordonia sp. X0973 TaxID=2742602 RepID=UPI0013EC199C|nr:PE-PPE domain-containing protein [Gordonia sp. X0973]QKT06709.1 PE-PPE domain-containing protein [Gordonia sp. X0973]
MTAPIVDDTPVTGEHRTRQRWTGAKRATAIAGIAGAVALGASFLSPPGGAHAACSQNGAVVVVPGTNDPTGRGSMGGIIDSAKAQGKDVIVVGYPTTLWPAGTVGYNQDVAMGKAATSAAISEYQSKCGVVDPDKDATDKTGHIQVVGYSQGARVAGDVLADIGQGKAGAPSAEGISGILYSDPRQAGRESGRGIEQSFLGVIPGLTMTGSRGGFGVLADSIVSVCSQGDPICDLPDLIHDPLGAIDGLIGYFIKHGDYPRAGNWGTQGPTADRWDWEDPSTWTGANNCQTLSNGGGTLCTKPQESSIGRLVSQLGDQLGIHDIPDFFGEINRVLNINGILPHANLADLQPVVDLVYNALPKLPYLTYHSGGYLPDVLTFGNLLGAIVPAISGQGTGPLVDAAKAIGMSVVSIVLIPVNGTIFWGNQLSQLIAHQDVFSGSTVKTIQALGQIPDVSRDWSLTPSWSDGGGPVGWGTTGATPQTVSAASTPVADKSVLLSKVADVQDTGLYRAAAAGGAVASGPVVGTKVDEKAAGHQSPTTTPDVKSGAVNADQSVPGRVGEQGSPSHQGTPADQGTPSTSDSRTRRWSTPNPGPTDSGPTESGRPGGWWGHGAAQPPTGQPPTAQTPAPQAPAPVVPQQTPAVPQAPAVPEAPQQYSPPQQNNTGTGYGNGGGQSGWSGGTPGWMHGGNSSGGGSPSGGGNGGGNPSGAGNPGGGAGGGSPSPSGFGGAGG